MGNPDDAISSEINVLIRCARRSLLKSDCKRLQALLQEPLDWELLLKLAAEHGLLPLLNGHLSESVTPNVPSDFLALLRTKSRESAMRALFLSSELVRVLDSLRENEIPAIPHKGPVLAMRVFGNPVLRQYNDLDVVVPQRFVEAVYEQMSKLGYEAKLPRARHIAGKSDQVPGEYVFVHGTNHAMVEFHTEQTLRYFPIVPCLDAMVRRATTVQLNGKQIPAFSREDELLLLAVHGTKDFWARLIWIADVAELAMQTPALDWEVLLARASEMRISRMLRLAILLAHELLELLLPTEVEDKIKSDRTARKLGAAICQRLHATAQPVGGIVERSLYRIRSVEGFWRAMSYWIRLSTAPAGEDWTMIDVPQPLSRAYYILRPVRLWKKYSQRSVRSR